jgi:hypothetical protein
MKFKEGDILQSNEVDTLYIKVIALEEMFSEIHYQVEYNYNTSRSMLHHRTVENRYSLSTKYRRNKRLKEILSGE